MHQPHATPRPAWRGRSHRPLTLRGLVALGLALTLVALAGPALAGGSRDGAAPAAGPVAGRAVNEKTPLSIRLITLSPATVPRTGPLVMSGTVRNDSTEVWQDINVHAFVSTTPITTAAELDAAAHTPYDQEVGTRPGTEHTFVPIGDLDPGQTTTFTLRIPRAELPIPDLPGVYWVGVHALGANAEGRDNVADGRARTFMPLVTAKKPRAVVDLVLPFRAEVRRNGDGSLSSPRRWAALLSANGRLERLLGFAESAGGVPLTLAVDPAVLDGANVVRAGPVDPSAAPAAPSADASPTDGTSTDGTPDPSASPSATPGKPAKTLPGESAKDAASWLSRFETLARTDEVLGTGYADPDLAALSEHHPKLVATAYRLGEQTLTGYQLQARPLAAPFNGYLPASALTGLDLSTTVLLADHGVPLDRPVWRTTAGQRLVFTDSNTASGGPGPGDRTDALALRQRIVAAAALSAQAHRSTPLVVALPPSWDPGPDWAQADFFGGLNLPWLRFDRLPDATGAPVREHLAFPESAQEGQVSQTSIAATRAAIAAARVYADVLIRPAGALDALTRLALQGSSYHALAHPNQANNAAIDLRRSIDARLAGIRVVGQPLVSMSGGSGTFVVTLVNDLDKRVRVGIHATTDSAGLTISPPASIVVPPHQRTTVRLPAKADEAGVRTVILSPVTDQGARIGTPMTLTVRSNQVGSLIWAIMGGAGALLLVMIVRRWIKRGLSRRSPGL